jgi:hypothetical protein
MVDFQGRVTPDGTGSIPSQVFPFAPIPPPLRFVPTRLNTIQTLMGKAEDALGL